MVPWLLPNQYLVHVVVLAGLYVILAVGLNLVMGYAGQVSLGHAGFYGLGAYVSAVLSVRYGLSPWLGMPVAAVATGALAYVVGIPTLRLKSYYLGMATLGIGAGAAARLRAAPRHHRRLVRASPGILPWDLGPLRFTTATHHYWLVWAVAALALWIARNLVNSRVGRVLRALGESEAAAEAMGVDTAAEKRRVFVLSAVYASVAGSLYAHYITVISPEIYSFLFSVVLVLMVAIGGIGLYWGAVVGAVLLTDPARGPAPVRRLGGAALRPRPHRGDPVPPARHRRALRARGAGGRAPLARARPARPAPAAEPARIGALAAPGARTAAGGSAPLLEVRGVTKQFGGVRAVRECSFDVAEGEIKAVIGPNGAGKTTLFNVITGFYAPTAGQVRLRGRPLTGLPAHRAGPARALAHVPEPPALPGPHRDRERDDRLRARRARRLPRRGPGPARAAAPDARRCASAPSARSPPWASRRSAPRPRRRPRLRPAEAGRGGARARRRARRCSCSTSPPPGSTPARRPR